MENLCTFPVLSGTTAMLSILGAPGLGLPPVDELEQLRTLPIYRQWFGIHIMVMESVATCISSRSRLQRAKESS